MAIFTAHLILDKIVGLMDLADIVVIAGYATEKRIGFDGLGGGFGEVGDGITVCIGSGGFQSETTKKRLAGIGQFQQRHARGDAEGFFDEGQEAENYKSASDSSETY